jgi:uncharacterized membrane protein YeiH
VEALDTWLRYVDFLAIGLFAASGALVAARKRLDPVGFILIGCVTGFGGGTVRDLLINRTPVFWLAEPGLIAIALGASLAVFFVAPWVQNQYRAILWADAAGLAIYSVLGADIAMRMGAQPWAAVLLGVITATAGGIVRDVICMEIPLILRREIYITAAAVAATSYVALRLAPLPRDIALPAGIALGFGLRALAILRGWSLPPYKARPAREYADRR